VHTGSVEWNTKLKGANAVRLFVFVLYLTLSFVFFAFKQTTALARILIALEDYAWTDDKDPSFPYLTLTVTPGMINFCLYSLIHWYDNFIFLKLSAFDIYEIFFIFK